MLKKILEKIRLASLKISAEPKWKTVLRSRDEAFIRIVQLKLESEEIPVLIFDQRDSSYQAFGEISLDVPSELFEKAEHILEEFNNTDTDERHID